MLIIEWSTTGVSQLPPIVIFALISLVSAFLAIRVYGSIGAAEPRRAVTLGAVEGAAPA